MDAGQIVHDRYELRDAIGKGGMAEVWAARDHHLDRDVAVKFLAPRLADDPEFLVRFFNEAQAIARISHPNVVQVLDFGEHEGTPYLVMEFVPGGSVADLSGTRRSPEGAVRLISGAARGAGAAHDNGIVHRDLKPGNILLDGEGTPRIADFGIAASEPSERLTATGAAIGSPHYISPEQATGGSATPASDVYALGIVLYELLTGVKPFDAENVTAIAIAHVDQTPRPPTEIVELPADIEAVVMRCLAKDPEERFATGTELAAALDAALSGASAPVPATAATAAVAAPADESLPAPSWWHGRRALVGTALALIALVALAVVVVARGDGLEGAAGAAETIENVGGLGIGELSPSPSEEAVMGAAHDPSPSPTKKEKDSDKTPSTKEGSGGSPKRSNGSGGGASSEPSPSPTPEPSDDATTAPNANPTPQPSP